MRLLIVEDETLIADSLKKGLEQESYAVDVTYDGESGYDMAAGEDYDCILLDRMLPGMTGSEICKKLRSEKVLTPILMLTAKSQITDIVDGLDVGADDYLTKPFEFDELLARIRALIRRPKTLTDAIVELESLRIDTNNRRVTRDNIPLKLSKTEYALLEYLVRNADRPLSKDLIIEHVWNFDADILPNTVEVYIGYLRNKIDKAFPQLPPLIHTIRGFGYKISTSKT